MTTRSGSSLARTFGAHPPLTVLLVWTLVLPIASAAPSTDTAHQEYERGKQLLHDGRFEEAEQAFERAKSIFQEGETAEPEPPAASTAAPSPIPVNPAGVDVEGNRRLARQHIEQAKNAMASHNRIQALIHAQHALELDPTNADAKQLVSETFQALKSPSTALERASVGKRRSAPTNVQKSPKPIGYLDGYPGGRRIQIISASELSHPSLKSMLGEYHITVGDVIEVFLWQQSDLSREVVVRPDGRISVPLVGDLDVVGMTLPELDDLLTERYREFVKMPDVSLAIKRFGGSKVMVLGEVSRPGIFVPSGEGKVLDVIAMAGWFTRTAGQDNVFLIRGGLGTPEIAQLNLDLKHSVQQGRLVDNVALQSDDIIFVPPGKVASVTQFLEQFYPTVNAALVGNTAAKAFGFDSTISNFWKKEIGKR